jgi:hypothetical protein
MKAAFREITQVVKREADRESKNLLLLKVN